MISGLKKTSLLSIAGVAGVLAVSPARSHGTPGFWNLDPSITNPYTGDTSSYSGTSNGINSAGVATVGTAGQDLQTGVAYTFTPTTASTGTITNITLPNNLYPGAYAINDAGRVAGGYYDSSFNPHAFGTDNSGVAQDLGDLGGGQGASAVGIDAAGDIAGTSHSSDGLDHAYVYTGVPGSGTMHDLGVADAGSSTEITGMNAVGQIVGYSLAATEKAVVYTGSPGSGHFTDLGTFPDPHTAGQADSVQAFGINNAGEVAGMYEGRYLTWHPGVYSGTLNYSGTTGTGTWHDLGFLPGGDIDSAGSADAVNDAGVIVGNSYVGSEGSHAFVYVGTPGAGGKMYDLQTWFLHNFSSAITAGWDLQYAYGINDAGMIVGSGTYTYSTPGVGSTTISPAAFEIDASGLIASAVPEPTALTVLSIAVMPLLARRRRTTTR